MGKLYPFVKTERKSAKMNLRKSAIEFNLMELLRRVKKLSIKKKKVELVKTLKLIEGKIYEISLLLEQLENK